MDKEDKNIKNNIINEYKIAWNNLRSDSKIIFNKTDIIDAEEDIYDKLKNLLYSFILIVSAEYADLFEIGRAIIQLNSYKFNERLRIPICGKFCTDINNRNNWKVNNDKWKNDFFKNERNINSELECDHELMYSKPEIPLHLLTELMWRFQSDTKSNKGSNDEVISIAIFKNKDDINNFIVDENKVKKIFLKENSLNPPLINEIKRKFNSFIPRNPKAGKYSYKNQDCKRLLENPYKILHGEDELYSEEEVNNIFYISEIDESNYLGAMDFELLIKWPDKERMNDFKLELQNKFPDFINNLRWNLGKYVIDLVSTIEKEYSSNHEVYKDKYFIKNTNGDYPGLIGLVNILNESKKKIRKHNKNNSKERTSWTKIEETINILINHFKIAGSDVGNYWRGYKRHTYEVSCCITSIIDVLFFPEKNISLEKIVREKGPNAQDLILKINKEQDIPFIFKQLFQGLDREKDLFLLPYYRDHFIHSFYCFCFGVIFITNPQLNIIKDKSLLNIFGLKNNKPEELLKKWFLVAMWHDIAYALQKGESMIENYILKFIKNEDKRFRGVLPWRPSLGHLLQINGILNDINKIAKDSICIKDDKNKFKEIIDKIELSDIIMAVAFDYIDHGVWSSLFVNHSLSLGSNIIDKLNKNMEIQTAIMSHHFYKWKYKDILNDFSLFHNNNIDNSLKKEFLENISDNVKIGYMCNKKSNNALGYLLCICDIFCQAGRDANEIADDLAESADIKYGIIKIEDSILCIGINYTESTQKEIDIDKFYIDPLKCLNLNFDNNKTQNVKDVIKICFEFSEKNADNRIIMPIEENL